MEFHSPSPKYGGNSWSLENNASCHFLNVKTRDISNSHYEKYSEHQIAMHHTLRMKKGQALAGHVSEWGLT